MSLNDDVFEMYKCIDVIYSDTELWEMSLIGRHDATQFLFAVTGTNGVYSLTNIGRGVW